MLIYFPPTKQSEQILLGNSHCPIIGPRRMRRERVFVLVWEVGERGESLPGGRELWWGHLGSGCEGYEEDVTNGNG